MKAATLALLGLITSSLASFTENPHILALRDIGVHNAVAQKFVLSLRDLDDHSGLHLRARSLDEHEIEARDIADAVTTASRGLLHRRMAMAEALARGGGGKTKSTPKQDAPGQPLGSKPDLKGLSPEGQKASKQCDAASKNQGDCGAMRGPFAEMGCTLGSLHSMKPCENKELQGKLRGDYCTTHKNDASNPFVKKHCK